MKDPLRGHITRLEDRLIDQYHDDIRWYRRWAYFWMAVAAICVVGLILK